MSVIWSCQNAAYRHPCQLHNIGHHAVVFVVNGIVDVSQANGIAGFSSNTIVLGWPKDPKLLADFLVTAQRLEKIQKSVVIGKINPRHIFPVHKSARQIHIWWGGLRQNGDLLLLAYLLTRNSEWRGAELTILSAASNEFVRENTSRYLEAMLKDIRIEAECNVFPKPPDKQIGHLIQEYSAEADVVFLGLAISEPGQELEYVNRLENIVGDLPASCFKPMNLNRLRVLDLPGNFTQTAPFQQFCKSCFPGDGIGNNFFDRVSLYIE